MQKPPDHLLARPVVPALPRPRFCHLADLGAAVTAAARSGRSLQLHVPRGVLDAVANCNLWLARRFGLVTPVGATLDALADKVEKLGVRIITGVKVEGFVSENGSGAVQAVEEAGWRPDAGVGVSIGAVNGWLLSRGVTAAEMPEPRGYDHTTTASPASLASSASSRSSMYISLRSADAG